MGKRFLLIGLDGAEPSLFEDWMERGVLPNLRKLRERGVWGRLRSTVPPTTPPAWASCVTGKNPGEHGILDFRESPLLDPDRPLISSRSVRGAKIWHILNGIGRRVAVVNVPLTYPPEPVDGVMISGMMTPGPDAPFTHPPELKERLRGYVVNVDIPRYDVERRKDALAFLRDVRTVFRRRKEAFFRLLGEERWDFFMIVFILPDRIQHLLWKYMDGSSPLYESRMGRGIRDEILGAFGEMDDMFGELDGRLDDETDLAVISDHGFGPTDAYFNANAWLESLGLLALRPEAARKKRLFYRAVRLNDSPLLKALLPSPLRSAVRKRIRKNRSTLHSAKADIEGAIDWRRTKAFFASIPNQGIYINVKRAGAEGAVEPGREAEALRKFLKEKLLELKDPRTGGRLVDGVHFREEIYRGPRTPFAPDVLFAMKNYAVLGRQLLGGREWFRRCDRTPNGFHRPDGIFLARGPGFKKGDTLSGASIMDILPTVLYAMGLPIPDDLDGKVLDGAFSEGLLADRPPEFRPVGELLPDRKEGEVYSEDDKEKLRSRLRALGYLE